MNDNGSSGFVINATRRELFVESHPIFSDDSGVELYKEGQILFVDGSSDKKINRNQIVVGVTLEQLNHLSVLEANKLTNKDFSGTQQARDFFDKWKYYGIISHVEDYKGNDFRKSNVKIYKIDIIINKITRIRNYTNDNWGNGNNLYLLRVVSKYSQNSEIIHPYFIQKKNLLIQENTIPLYILKTDILLGEDSWLHTLPNICTPNFFKLGKIYPKSIRKRETLEDENDNILIRPLKSDFEKNRVFLSSKSTKGLVDILID